MRALLKAVLPLAVACSAPPAHAQAVAAYGFISGDGAAGAFAANDATDQPGRPVSLAAMPDPVAMAFGQAGPTYVRSAASTVAGTPASHTLLSAYSYAYWRYAVTPSVSATVTANAWFDGRIQLGDPLTMDDRVAAIDLGDASFDTLDDNQSRRVFDLASQISFAVSLHDLTSETYQDLSVANTLTRTITVTRRDDELSVGTSFYGTIGSTLVNRPCGMPACTPTINYFAGTEIHDARNYDFDLSFVAGHDYVLLMQIGCQTSLSAEFGNLDGVAATCDAAHSGYWNGLTNIGTPGFSLIAPHSGFNYVYSSPLSPSPLVPAGVPEPSEWAMLIGGFSLLGLARRGRASPRARSH